MHNAVVFFVLAFFAFYTTQAFRRKCPKSCSDAKKPICGSDGNTYNNPCMLDFTACKQKRTILMVHTGRCNPCTTYECVKPPNSKCVAKDGLPTCVCTYKCLPVKKPVCGSDGHTYPNECELQKNSCLEKLDIKIASPGPCGKTSSALCGGIRCPGTSICRVILGRTKCVGRKRCRRFCTREYRPVCATNGRTYSNQCVIDRMACNKNRDVVFSYKGRCRVARGACRRKRCPRGTYCQMKRRQARCVRACQRFCPRVHHPVCADDGRTYTNDCLRRLEVCLTRTQIAVVHAGICRDSRHGCNMISCAPQQVCKNIFGHPKCYKRVCKRWCPRVYRAVCADNGKTYPNECEMKMQACRNRQEVEILHAGRCRINVGCSIWTCIFKQPYSTCKVINKKPTCVCKTKCPHYLQSVCGSDQKTYNTLCHLERTACQTVTRISKLYDGKCIETCETKNCSYLVPHSFCRMVEGQGRCLCQNFCNHTVKPVCGSNGRTYSNLCLMKRTSCRINKLITVKYIGKCSRITCEKKNCSSLPYSTCKMVNEKPTCTCPTTCTKILKPVCGSDGVTYSNVCLMEKASCENHTMVNIKNNGKCEELPKANKSETCAKKSCSSLPYSTCKMINSTAICTCPTSCAKILKPVCGSDGVTYSNVCLMEKASCENNIIVTIKSNGECKVLNDTCEQKNCSSLPYSTCKMINSTAICTCPTLCAKILKPVCGSDGVTYSNVCIMEQASCENNTIITIKSNGECEELSKANESETCSKKSCSSFPYSTCKMINSTAICTCPTSCAKILKPVCGSDGVTYSNVCIMEKASCENKTLITIKNNGECKVLNHTCARKDCSSMPYSTCKMMKDKPTCVCSTSCTKILKPVCGSDGVTYSNVCLMEEASCENKTIITTKSNGKCEELPKANESETCAKKSCSSLPYSTCKMINSTTICTCPTSCTKILKPVCGSDGVTYSNVCIMEQASCENKTLITIKSNGECGAMPKPNESETCAKKNCSNMPYSTCKMMKEIPTCVCSTSCTKILKPVCGSDGVTYSNVCLMEKASCENKTRILVKMKGQCNGNQACQQSTCSSWPYSACQIIANKTTCVCNTTCPISLEPVCGSDGVSYLNSCEMEKTSCQSKTLMTVVKQGFCEDVCLRKDCAIELPYSSCKVISNIPTCVCQPYCTDEYQPVCGSDNVTYSNDCVMRKTSCETSSWVVVKYVGSCNKKIEIDTCARKNCSSLPYSTCKMINSTAICTCPTSCTKILKPVCGSDGVTYSNVCLMEKASCENNTMVTIKSNGKCEGARCKLGSTCKSPPYSRCVSSYGRSVTCLCPRFCSTSFKPVCGSDGKLYGNLCVLQKASCDSKTTITTVHIKKCRFIRGCTDVICRRRQICKKINNQPRCVSRFCVRRCPVRTSLVCGSDNNTYKNGCELTRKACRENRRVKRVKYGRCTVTSAN